MRASKPVACQAMAFRMLSSPKTKTTAGIILLIFFLSVTGSGRISAQHLAKKITLKATREPLSVVLQTIGAQGDFYFSYNSKHIPEDSLVTLNVTQHSVREILDRLVGDKIQYQEKEKYIILKPRENQEHFAVIAGKVVDEETADAIEFASVYSTTTLISTITDDAGNFRLRIREKALPITLTISRVGYQDTLWTVSSAGNYHPTVRIKPQAIQLEEVVVTNDGALRNFLSGFLVSTRLRIHNLNIGRYFVDFPFQLSLTPGLGTNGRMSSQVTNKVSVNLIGGYTAGVDGVEIAGGFNISMHNVRYFQAAGLFNVVNGTMKGFQAAGLHNNVLDSLAGMQAAGISNSNREDIQGFQVAGILNRAEKSVRGVQAAGIFNRSENLEGVQISGFINHTKGEVKGGQIGVFNRARRVSGIQIGVINVADSTDGLSIGMFNFIRYSPSHFSFYHSDLVPVNLAWKTGTHKLYSILTLGTDFRPDPPTYSLGFGVGHTTLISDKWQIQTEALSQSIYKGSFHDMPSLLRLQLLPNLKLTRRLSLVAGPVLNFAYHNSRALEGLRIPAQRSLRLSDSGRLWLGWTAGANFYYGKLK